MQLAQVLLLNGGGGRGGDELRGVGAEDSDELAQVEATSHVHVHPRHLARPEHAVKPVAGQLLAELLDVFQAELEALLCVATCRREQHELLVLPHARLQLGSVVGEEREVGREQLARLELRNEHILDARASLPHALELLPLEGVDRLAEERGVLGDAEHVDHPEQLHDPCL